MIQKTNERWRELSALQTNVSRIILNGNSSILELQKKINKLVQEIKRAPFEGVGKPEPLRGNYSGYWSRRIDEKHRLIYRVETDDSIHFIQCHGHYDD